MSLLSKSQRADASETAAVIAGAGAKICLNFGAHTSEAVRSMAAQTLQSGGFDPASAQPKTPEIGGTMPDGTIYAGVSPDTGKPMYAAPADAPLTKTFNEAADYASKLDAHGHRDWRVPSKAELNVLFNNQAAIGGFDVSGSNPGGWYWSSSSLYNWDAWDQRFSDGCQSYDDKDNRSSVRCVR